MSQQFKDEDISLIIMLKIYTEKINYEEKIQMKYKKLFIYFH